MGTKPGSNSKRVLRILGFLASVALSVTRAAGEAGYVSKAAIQELTDKAVTLYEEISNLNDEIQQPNQVRPLEHAGLDEVSALQAKLNILTQLTRKNEELESLLTQITVGIKDKDADFTDKITNQLGFESR